MSRTRDNPAVCSCRSHGCAKGRFKGKDGRWQYGGSIVDRITRETHLQADARMEALLNNNQDSDSSESGRQEDDEDLREEEKSEVLCSDASDLGSEINRINEVTLDSCSSNLEKVNVYECRPFYDYSALRVQPQVLHVCLLAAVLAIFEDTSVSTSSWFLKSARDLLSSTANGFEKSDSGKLKYFQKKIIEAIPLDIRTVIRWLNLDPPLIRVVCCPVCFAMYPFNSQTPKQCMHLAYSGTGTEEEDEDHQERSSETPDHDGISRRMCGASLFRLSTNGIYPVKIYAFQNLYDWIARLFSREGIEEALELAAATAKKPYDPEFEASDIQDSRKWKTFLGPDRKPYTAESGNLTFGMFVDAINPHGNRQAGKHISITFIIMVCLSLPVSLRYKPQNIFVVGIAPGPKEPSLEQINWILRPAIEQLKVLWQPGLFLSQTRLHPKGRRICGALLPFFADLPALRRSLGFSAPTATRMCSYCLLEKSKISNLDPETWPRRKLSDHKYWAHKSRDAADAKTRMKILKAQGVRYSALLELPYWDILDNHVVDAMHNLLLGMLKWHCQRFWCMSDEADELEPKGIPTTELMSLLADIAAPIKIPPRPGSPTATETDTTEGTGLPFNLMAFRSNETSDDSFSPFLEDAYWGGPWTAPSSGKIIFDKDALSFINQLLPRIHIPTWIKRAIPALGKASFGRLKADEWRNLFTIQLPLILPVYWADGGASGRSLFQNFAHLVSSVNLALKRTMSAEKVKKYRFHNLEYLKSCLILFPDITLAPNHHVSVHLADCLDKYGPSRAWWSFSMERLMGKILKTSHNNRLGQLEITFLVNFCRFGNLEALMSEPERFPLAFIPHLNQIRGLNHPIPPKTQLIPKSRQDFLDQRTLKLLVARINELFPAVNGLSWISSSEWCQQTKTQSRFLPINADIEKLQDYVDDDVVYSSFHKNPANSLIKANPLSMIQYGFIQKIFSHQRTFSDQSCKSDTWLLIQSLAPAAFKSPFSRLDDFEMQLELKIVKSKEIFLVHSSEIITNCAWIKYRSGEISSRIENECIALVSLER